MWTTSWRRFCWRIAASIWLSEKPFEVFNVATGDYITVTEIAKLAIEVAGLSEDQVRLEYTGGDRGWKGDVPIVRLNTDRIRSLGWTSKRNTSAGAMRGLEFHARRLQAGEAVTMRRAVFLDRDGVVNRAVLRKGKPYPPATLSDLRLLPGVREACNYTARCRIRLDPDHQPARYRARPGFRPAGVGNEPSPAALSTAGWRRRLSAR